MVEGTVHADPAEIAEQIRIQAGEEYRVGLQTLFRDDIRRIMALEKFVDVNVEVEPVPEGIRLIYHVSEKPMLVGLRFEGNQKLKDKKLRQELKWDQKARVFMDLRRLEVYRKRLLSLYEERSYPRTTITAELEEQETPFETVAVFAITEGEQLPLKRLTLVGNTEYSDRQIRRRIKTKASWGILSWDIFKRDYIEAAVKQDLQVIQSLYEDRGYLDTEATAEGPVEEEKGLGLTIRITEGPRYRIGKVSVTGNQIFSDEEILNRFTLEEGDFYSEGTVLKDLLAILNLFRDQGNFFTRVQKRREKRAEELVVDVVILIREGERLRLGDVQVQGVTRMADTGEIILLEPDEFSTKDYVILREIKLKKGDVLDWSQILEADRRLVNLQYFKTRPFPLPDVLNLDPGFSDPLPREDDPMMADLLLQLEEVRTGLIAFGPDYNTTFGFGFGVELHKRNLFGRGKDLSSTVRFGELEDRFAVRLYEPYLWGSDYSLDTLLQYRDVEPYYGRLFNERSATFRTIFSHPFQEYSRYFFGVRAQESEINVEDEPFETVRAPGLYDSDRNLTTSVLLGLGRDTRDFPSNPTRGTYNRGTVELAGLADNEFVKFTGETSYYRSLTEKLILALMAEIELAEPFGGDPYLPLQERFWIGGPYSVRGFEIGSLTERDTITRRRFYPDLGIYERTREIRLGSEATLRGSAELRYPFFEMLQGVVFLDSGAGYTEIGDIDLGQLRFSTGVGVRVNLPIGAVRLDYAIPVKTEPDDDEESFHFSFGHMF